MYNLLELVSATCLVFRGDDSKFEQANFENFLGTIVFLFDSVAYYGAWWVLRNGSEDRPGVESRGKLWGWKVDVLWWANFWFTMGSLLYVDIEIDLLSGCLPPSPL